MKRTILVFAVLVSLSSSAVAAPAGGLIDFLTARDRALPDLDTETFCPTAQRYPGTGPVRIPRSRAKSRLGLFPGPTILSLEAGISYCPLIGGMAADETSPHLAQYRAYWDSGFSIHAELHLHALSIADAYVSAGILHHPSSGKQNWYKTVGTDDIRNRYRFSPLYIYPVEFGGKGYLPLKAPPGLHVIDPNRKAPMLYLRIGAGPALVSRVDFSSRRYVNGALAQTIEEVWWPTQSVLNVHVAFGFEWGNFRSAGGKKGGGGVPVGLFAEVGLRYIGAPVVTEFADVSDPILSATFTIGAHLP